MVRKAKTTTDLSAKHFSRYGEFLASFELSKHGWDSYSPLYDEYTDLMIHKILCGKCGELWNTNPKLLCGKCNKEITSSNKSRIIANVKCKDCNTLFEKKSNCPKCKSMNLENMPTCPFCKEGIIKIQEHGACMKCNSTKFKEMFRTIQVKASRLEPSGKTYAVDLKPRDLSQGANHFYIWICIDERDIPHFLVIPIKKFEVDARNFLKSMSFLKDQGREHFNRNTFGKWAKYIGRFDLLD